MRVLLFMMGKINFKTMENSNDNSVQKDANTKEIVTPPKNKQED